MFTGCFLCARTVLDTGKTEINKTSQFASCLVEPYEIAVGICEKINKYW